MTEIKEITTLNTVASVRKAAQQSMRPVISEVEEKMNKIETQMQEITRRFFDFSNIERKISKNQEANRYVLNQILSLSDKLSQSELQMQIDREHNSKNNEDLRQQLRRMQRERQKLDLAFHTLESKTNRTINSVTETVSLMKDREKDMHNRFHQFKVNSQKLNQQAKENAEKIKDQFENIKNHLNNQLKQNSKRMQIIDMYQAEKQLNFSKFSDIFEKLEDFVKISDFDFYKMCNVKDQNRVVEKVEKIFEQQLSQTTRSLISQLPHFKLELEHVKSFQSGLEAVIKKVEDIIKSVQILDNESKKETFSFKNAVEEHFENIQIQRKDMQTSIDLALALKGLIKNKIEEYSQQFKLELKQQNEEQNKRLYEEIKRVFLDTREALRQQELDKIVEERKKLEHQCIEITELGGSIKYKLANFSTKFTKMRSDNELFTQRVNRQLQQIDEIKAKISLDGQTTGKIIAHLTEAVLATYCLNIQQQSSTNEEVMLTTENDGVIYQKFSSQIEKDKILYRRKIMDPYILRKAVAFSLVETYDELMNPDCCLKWHENGPNNFFKSEIEPTYLQLFEKKDAESKQFLRPKQMKDTIDLSTINARQTISSNFDRGYQSQSRNINSVRSRRTRYSEHESAQIFAHKSTRRFRIALNSSLGMT